MSLQNILQNLNDNYQNVFIGLLFVGAVGLNNITNYYITKCELKDAPIEMVEKKSNYY